MSESMFTIEAFQEMKAKLAHYPPPVVGIVCKPSLEMAIRTKMMEVKHDPYSFGGLWGIEVFVDIHQCQDILTFTDDKLLRTYLNRKVLPDSWARALMRHLFKNDRTRARIYRIPYALPAIVEF